MTTSFIYVIYSIYMCVILSENVGIRQIMITGVYIIISFALIFFYRKKKLLIYIMPAFFLLTLLEAVQAKQQ